MNKAELRNQALPDLQQTLVKLLRELFNLRMQRGVGSDVQLHRIRQVRRQIARVKTLMTEKGYKG